MSRVLIPCRLHLAVSGPTQKECAMRSNVLITGGAGFVGSNLAASLLRDGGNVTVVDALLRRGSEHNLAWLRDQDRHGRLRFLHADVRDAEAMVEATKNADVIYHFAAQVAVTSSVVEPRTDFECNAL